MTYDVSTPCAASGPLLRGPAKAGARALHRCAAITLALGLLALGCEGGKARSAPLTGFTFLRDGKPMAMYTALAKLDGEREIDLLVSSKSPSCADHLRGLRAVADDEVSFSAGVVPLGKPGETQRWKLSYVSFDYWTDNTIVGKGSLSAITPQGRVGVSLDFHMTTPYDDRPKHTIVVRGTVDATWCGPMPPQ